MKNILFVLAVASMIVGASAKGKLTSANGKLEAEIIIEEHPSIEFRHNGNPLFTIKDICVETSNGFIPEKGSALSSVTKSKVDEQIVPTIKERNAFIQDKYSEAVYTFSDKSKISVRLYDNGIAYRITSNKDEDITVLGEPTEFVFDTISTLYWQKTDRNSYEFPYIETTIGSAKNGEFGPAPALVKLPGGESVVFLESDVVDYPIMWVEKGKENLKAHFWKYPKKLRGGDYYYNIKNIVEYEDYIAKTSGTRDFPWRILAFAEEEGELLNNELVYQMGAKCRIDDPSWIKPGWVMFDWWGKYGVYGVDFKAGMNNPTAKYMIDFCSKYGIRYFLFDDGWTIDNDLTKCKEDLDFKEITEYAAAKGVDIMLWVPYSLLDDQMDTALKQFKQWGIKGIKIDFMDRDDQEIVGFYWRAAQKAAENEMVIDFHGAYRPDGLRRAYPNVLTREAILEFEMNGGLYDENPRHHCLLPFLRCVAGPADYIPGTMNNATKDSFHPYWRTPMGQGTRTHSMAMALVVESPMQMLPDGPSDYLKEPECTQ